MGYVRRRRLRNDVGGVDETHDVTSWYRSGLHEKHGGGGGGGDEEGGAVKKFMFLVSTHIWISSRIPLGTMQRGDRTTYKI